MPKKKFRVLSGDEIIKILEREGFAIVYGRGSHCKLARFVDGVKQKIVIPRHKEIKKGTLKAIYSQVTQYIPESRMKTHFYTG